MKISQEQFIREFNETHREEFNQELFDRNDDDIIREIEKVILSCQRHRAFRIKVINFSVVDDYNEINRLMREYETLNSNRKKSPENKYDFIQLKDTDMRLLIVDYFIEVYNTTKPGERSKILRVYIQIPRLKDKYYFRIGGNMDLSMLQVIESTYNNSYANNSIVGMVAYKTMFMASRIFRFNIENSKKKQLRMIDLNGEIMKGIYFSSIIFNKSVHVMKYLLARFGVYETMKRLKCQYIEIVPFTEDIKDFYKMEQFYIIPKNKLALIVPRYIYDNDPVTQSLVYTIFSDIDQETDMNNIFTKEYWLIRLGRAFGSKLINTPDKGYSILESLESICDASSMEHLRLPEEDKIDIYDIIVWLVREFSELRIKDNLDIGMKRIRWAEYFACIYAYKLIKGIYRISDKGNKITLQSIEKSINIAPDYLIRLISRDKLTSSVSMANDMDSVAALKYTYKGVSGLGEDDTSIPMGYRQVHDSHIGRVDLDSSSNSDPGMTGTVCPISDIHNGAFSDEPEPNEWREKIEELHSNYREMYGIKQMLIFKRELGLESEDDKSRIENLDESMGVCRSLLNPLSSLDKKLYGNYLFSEVQWEDD